MVGEGQSLDHTTTSRPYLQLRQPPSLVKWGVMTQVLCLTFATTLVAMRLYTKFRVLRNPGWDDCKPYILSVVHP